MCQERYRGGRGRETDFGSPCFRLPDLTRERTSISAPFIYRYSNSTVGGGTERLRVVVTAGKMLPEGNDGGMDRSFREGVPKRRGVGKTDGLAGDRQGGDIGRRGPESEPGAGRVPSPVVLVDSFLIPSNHASCIPPFHPRPAPEDVCNDGVYECGFRGR